MGDSADEGLIGIGNSAIHSLESDIDNSADDTSVGFTFQ